MEHIRWHQGKTLLLLDQRKLPLQKEYVSCQDYLDVAAAIKNMTVRGAPAIGAVAAYGMAMAAMEFSRHREEGGQGMDAFLAHLETAARHLKGTRPTAVNLGWAVDRMLAVAHRGQSRTVGEIAASMVREAVQLAADDVDINRKIGRNGLSLLQPGARVLTYCNAGALATAGYGTALGVIRAGQEAGKVAMVYACETRPYLQGARLTAYELCQEGIPVTLITDNTVGYIMYNKMLDMVVVGADRITRCGHVANKIGTYTLAILAKEHGIPFYVAAPLSTFDMRIEDAKDIPIEERDAMEVTHIGGKRIACEGVEVYNPAFDITPASLITALITDAGVVREPDSAKITKLFREGRGPCF